MKFSILPLLLITANAFHILHGIARTTPGRLNMARPEQKNIESGMQHAQALIDSIDKGNMEESLNKLEPFLMKEASTDDYNDIMRKLNRKAHHLGMEIPHDFASDPSHQPPFCLHGGDESMDKTAGSGMQLQHVDFLIDHLSDSNFEASLDMIEAFLINEADEAFTEDAVRRIESKASALGKSIPENYGEKIDRVCP